MINSRGGTWAHIVALNNIWREVNEPTPDMKCLLFRNRVEDDILRLHYGTSELYHNMNAEIVLVTNDRKIVLTRRPGGGRFFNGCWTSSLEEQVLREKMMPVRRVISAISLT